ncbi:MFS transporter [Sphingomonas sp. BIUV-7]|uniref:MFS transporter n=1 Tax=Sphingomonas natans TaxID=3063330 RepID=A0ABT8YB51_9SPHN|nr:MFS transporter [Sphingomonas sp. BIUV-7]MDO6415063.1 MFS transporter [Sphingomonas sp. BIUV-7]
MMVETKLHTPIRSILGASGGNLVEWYDWYAYSAFTLYFAPALFPKSDPTAQLLSAAAIFAVGFVMRPLGAWIMGVYADRHGRKAGLTLSVTLMCVGSLLIAVTPPFASVGLLAPAMLLLARLMQGLSVGGEYGASATYLSEIATSRHRGFYSSFQYVTLIAGQLVALCLLLLLQAVLTPAELEAWGWRIPFLIGGALAIAVFFIRRRMEETRDFTEAKAEGAPKSSGLALFRDHPRAVALVMGLTAGGTVAFYAYSIYMQKFLVNTAGFGRETATLIMAAALFCYMLLQPAVGALSDRIGRRPLLIAFGVLGALGTVPLFRSIAGTGGHPLLAFALVMCGLVAVSGYTAINAVVKAELFPAHIRALGVALPYAIANAVFGGSAEYVALLFKSLGAEQGFYWYVAGLIAVSLIVFVKMSDTRARSTIGA